MVKKRDKTGLDVEIDESTNSIKNVISGDSFSTDISRITKADLSLAHKRLNKCRLLFFKG